MFSLIFSILEKTKRQTIEIEILPRINTPYWKLLFHIYKDLWFIIFSVGIIKYIYYKYWNDNSVVYLNNQQQWEKKRTILKSLLMYIGSLIFFMILILTHVLFLKIFSLSSLKEFSSYRFVFLFFPDNT